MITINTAKEPIRVWIPVLVKEKGSKKMNDLHFPRRVYTKDETFELLRVLNEVIEPDTLNDFLHCYPSIDKCEEFIDKIIEESVWRNNISGITDIKYVGIASAVIPQHSQYVKKQKGIFVCTKLEILDKKLDWYKEIKVRGEKVDQEEFYIITTLKEGEEKFRIDKIVPGASQIINIDEEWIENNIVEEDCDLLNILYVIYASREEAEKAMNKMSTSFDRRLRSVRIPDCCNVYSIPCIPNIFLTRGIIPGREILREVINKPKKENQEMKTSEISTPLPTSEPKENEVREIKGKKQAEDKKSTTEYVGYHSHTLLNPPYLTATSSITCIDSYQQWEGRRRKEENDEDGYRDLLVEIADCRGKIRLHNRGGDFEEFINKLVTLRGQLDLFIDHLKETKDPEEVIKKAKLNFPNRYGEV